MVRSAGSTQPLNLPAVVWRVLLKYTKWMPRSNFIIIILRTGWLADMKADGCGSAYGSSTVFGVILPGIFSFFSLWNYPAFHHWPRKEGPKKERKEREKEFMGVLGLRWPPARDGVTILTLASMIWEPAVAYDFQLSQCLEAADVLWYLVCMLLKYLGLVRSHTWPSVLYFLLCATYISWTLYTDFTGQVLKWSKIYKDFIRT